MALSQEQYAELATSPDFATLANFTGVAPAAESLAVTPTAAAPAASGFNVADYLAVNPDLVASWESGGRMRELGATMEEAGARHWIEQGSGEDRPGAPSFAVKPGELDDQMRVFGDTNTVYGGQNGAYKFGADDISALDYANLLTRNDKAADPLRVSGGQINPSTPAAGRTPYSGQLDYESLSKLAVGNPEFGMYGGSAGSYQPPSLMQADPTRGFNTPYYAAYTNDGDLAGAVMAGVGQGIRLVDAKTGEVVFEGTGPEAAQQAVGIANAVSDDRGRKAAWRIEADYGDKGWVAQAAERYDPKKTGLLGSLADIALPILGAMALGPIGAALGSGVSSAAQGRSLKDSLIRAGLSYGGAQLAPGVSEAIGGALTQGATQGAAQGLTQAGAQGLTQGVTNAAAQGAGTLLSEVVVNGVRTLIPAAVSTSLGAGAGSLAGGALTGGGGGGTSAPTQPSQPAQPATPPTDLEGLVVTGIRNGITPAQLIAMGVPAAVVTAAVAGGGAGAAPPTTVGEVVVEAPPTQPVNPAVVAGGAAATGGLLAALSSGNPAAVSDWIKANPLEAAGLGLTVGGLLLGGSGGGGGGSFAVPGGPGSRGSLSPLYSAALPAPTMGAGRTPRDATVDTRYAIERPEAAFFSNVTPRGASQFAVPTPSANRLAGIGDINDDGAIDELDLALFRKRFSGQGYAQGGYAVGGEGDGRSDDIEARLSDGEYVIDAETVALLGNGSSKAGADALDKLRVAVRKHKGRDLAKGRFSADARDAHDYLEAR